ncbi:hypothetical protein Droror1_Dr00002183 [Drosera rotundifolia]
MTLLVSAIIVVVAVVDLVGVCDAVVIFLGFDETDFEDFDIPRPPPIVNPSLPLNGECRGFGPEGIRWMGTGTEVVVVEVVEGKGEGWVWFGFQVRVVVAAMKGDEGWPGGIVGWGLFVKRNLGAPFPLYPRVHTRCHNFLTLTRAAIHFLSTVSVTILFSPRLKPPQLSNTPSAPLSPPPHCLEPQPPCPLTVHLRHKPLTLLNLPWSSLAAVVSVHCRLKPPGLFPTSTAATSGEESSVNVHNHHLLVSSGNGVVEQTQQSFFTLTRAAIHFLSTASVTILFSPRLKPPPLPNTPSAPLSPPPRCLEPQPPCPVTTHLRRKPLTSLNLPWSSLATVVAVHCRLKPPGLFLTSTAATSGEESSVNVHNHHLLVSSGNGVVERTQQRFGRCEQRVYFGPNTNGPAAMSLIE